MEVKRKTVMQVKNLDGTLWDDLKRGDRTAFGQIYRTYSEELIRYGYRITTNRQLIKDSIQDLFLHIWLHREQLSATDSIRFYLFRSLRNRIIKNLEMNKPFQDSGEVDLQNMLADFPFERTLIEQELHQEQIARLKQALDQLPKRQQEVIQLRFHHNFELEEIASMLQINNQSVRNLLHRSISHLRDYFEMEGWLILLFALFF